MSHYEIIFYENVFSSILTVETYSCEIYSVKHPNKAFNYNPLQKFDFQILHRATFDILALTQVESCST